MAYNTLEDIKAYLGVDKPGDDALLEALIPAAESRLETLVGGFTFEADADSDMYFSWYETYDPTPPGGYGRLGLYFGRWLADAPTTVLNNADAASPETVASTDYILLPRDGPPYHSIRLLASKGTVWSYDQDPENAIKITGPWGWSTTPPEDVKYWHKRLVTYWYRLKDNMAEGDRPLVLPGGSVVLPNTTPKDVVDGMAHYAWH